MPQCLLSFFKPQVYKNWSYFHILQDNLNFKRLVSLKNDNKIKKVRFVSEPLNSSEPEFSERYI